MKILIFLLFATLALAQNNGIRSLNGSLNNSQRLTVDTSSSVSQFKWTLSNGVHTLNIPYRIANLSAGGSVGNADSLGGVPASDYARLSVSNTFTRSNRFDSSIFLYSIQFDTTNGTFPNKDGLLRWNETDHTLDLGTSNGLVTQQIGQELFIRVVNKTGATISEGKLVRINGSQGNRPTATLAIGNVDASSQVIGMTTEDIANNQEGFVTTYGYVRQINTSAYPESTVLYLSATSAGEFTDTLTKPHHQDQIGIVTNQHANQGSVLIQISRHKSLGDLSDVIATSPRNYNLLTYDSTNGYWKNADTLNGSYRWTSTNYFSTIGGGTWNGTSIDTAYTNSVSKITAGYGLTATKNAKDYTITFDSATVRSKFVPYSGANASVNLGAQTFTTTGRATVGVTNIGTTSDTTAMLSILSTTANKNGSARPRYLIRAVSLAGTNSLDLDTAYTMRLASPVGTNAQFQINHTAGNGVILFQTTVGGRVDVNHFNTNNTVVGLTAGNNTLNRITVNTSAGVNLTKIDSLGGITASSLSTFDSLRIKGARYDAIDTTSVPITLNNQNTILCNNTSNITITLPALALAYNSATKTGKVYNIKKNVNNSATITVDANGAEKIDGDLTQIISAYKTNLVIQAYATGWVIL